MTTLRSWVLLASLTPVGPRLECPGQQSVSLPHLSVRSHHTQTSPASSTSSGEKKLLTNNFPTYEGLGLQRQAGGSGCCWTQEFERF